MPNISGEDLCEFIKLKKPQLIVFAYTGNVMPSQIDYFRTIGFAEIIEKPITLPSLKLKLARHFNLKALQEMELLT